MRTITEAMITDLIRQAADSERKRIIYRLHEHDEPVQRMVNAVMPGTYVTPHHHGNPPKVELIAILRGKVAVLKFTPDGSVEEVHILTKNSPVQIVDIAPGEYHNMVALEPSAVLEIVQGPFDPATHKQFAAWAPQEGKEDHTEYLQGLVDYIQKLEQNQ